MNPLTRTHYMGIAKIIRNAPLEMKQKEYLVKAFLDFLIPFTPCFDKKKFKEVALQEL